VMYQVVCDVPICLDMYQVACHIASFLSPKWPGDVWPEMYKVMYKLVVASGVPSGHRCIKL